MKFKLIFITICAIILMLSTSCSEDKKSSSSTGIDFTKEWIADYDYILMFDTNYYSPLQLETRDFPETSELIINDFEINTTNWVPSGDEYGDWLNWYCIFDNDIPGSLNLSPGSLLEISLTINGTNKSGNLTLPQEIVVDFPEFEVTEDYHFYWEISVNPNTQIVWFGCGNDNWSDDVFGNYQLSASTREYTIQKSLYSGFVETGVEWFQIGIDAANYSELGKCLYLSVNCGLSYEGYSKHISNKAKHRMIINQIMENR